MQSRAEWNCDDTDVSNTTSDRRLHVDLVFVCGTDLCVSANIQYMGSNRFLSNDGVPKIEEQT